MQLDFTQFKKALEVYESLRVSRTKAILGSYVQLGLTQQKRAESKLYNAWRALRRLSDALRVRKLFGDRIKEAETLKNIGNVHRERNEFELALEHYDDCLSIRIAELGRDNECVADALMSLGNVKSDMELHEDALSTYKEGKQSGFSINNCFVLCFKFVSQLSYSTIDYLHFCSFSNIVSNLWN